MDDILNEALERIVAQYFTEDQCCSLALDIATTRGMKSAYLGVVVSFFDDADQFRRIALDLRKMSGNHVAKSIKLETEDVLKRWKLNFDNIVGIVTDGARNMKAAFK